MLKRYIDKNEIFINKTPCNTTQAKTDLASIPEAPHPLHLPIMTTALLN